MIINVKIIFIQFINFIHFINLSILNFIIYYLIISLHIFYLNNSVY